MKRKSRSILLLLACLMALSGFAACSGKEQPPVDTQPTQTGEDEETYDWGNKEFTFMERELDPSVSIYYEVFTEGQKGEIINDALFRRNLLIEDTFNVKLVSMVESANNTTRRNTVTNVLNSGDETP